MEAPNTRTALAIRTAWPGLLQFKASKEIAVPVHFQVEVKGSAPIADWVGTDDVISYSQNQIVLTLDDNGVIRSCSKTAGKLLGCPVKLLAWRHISSLLPQLARMALIKNGQINPRLRFLSRIGHEFQFVAPDGMLRSVQLFISDLESYNRHFLRLIICMESASVRH